MFLFITGVVRVGDVNGKFVVNPSADQLSTSVLNLIVACTSKKIGNVCFPITLNASFLCQVNRVAIAYFVFSGCLKTNLCNHKPAANHKPSVR